MEHKGGTPMRCASSLGSEMMWESGDDALALNCTTTRSPVEENARSGGDDDDEGMPRPDGRMESCVPPDVMKKRRREEVMNARSPVGDDATEIGRSPERNDAPEANEMLRNSRPPVLESWSPVSVRKKASAISEK